jgi:uroporphyrinogen-III decarboxylase
MFMWPLLTFGWELFLETCLDERFERIMDEFAEINRRVFRVFARLPVNFVVCHDDIVTSRGPVCSPEWMHKYIFPRYEEFWGMLRATGKRVIFMVDGCIDRYADDVMACGATGFVTEPYTDFKALARRHENCVLAGEGDNRILMRNNPREIRAMVETMVETAQMTGGYIMCIGNHIPWNVPPEAVKRYFDLSAELAHR